MKHHDKNEARKARKKIRFTQKIQQKFFAVPVRFANCNFRLHSRFRAPSSETQVR